MSSILDQTEKKTLDLRWVFRLFNWVMALFCDLQVEVNGEETFMVDKKLMSSYSGRFSKLFGKSTGSARSFKVLFNDFPGGPESFELISKFCYNNGSIDITPHNISLLYSAAHFMEMKNSTYITPNLVEQTEKSLQEINEWTWPDLLITLRQCQSLNCFPVLEKCIDFLIRRIALSSESSPCPSSSSPDSSGFRFSCDTRSTESFKNSFARGTWWFEDLLVLRIDVIEMIIKYMVSHKLDHSIISKFLCYYQKSKLYSPRTDEKRKVVETIINMLYILDRDSVLCKNLFGILRVSLSLNISKCSRNKLEDMIGSQMDKATLDNLLIPSPHGISYLYDVNIVIRFVKAFLEGGKGQLSSKRLKKVAKLMDMYITEVAPDPCLRPSKFLALATALPDSVKDSYDEIYRATDIYLEVHSGLSSEEKMKICCALNHEKLSAEACIHLSENKKFSSQALRFQQHLFIRRNDSKCHESLSSSLNEKGNTSETNKEIVLYSGKIGVLTDNEKLREHLQGMQCRVMELEKVCSKMQSQMTKIIKSKASIQSNSRSLPRLCS